MRVLCVLLLISAICLIAVLFGPTSADNELEMKQSHYCEMLQIHKDSNGQYGWPPYNGECDD